MILSELRHQFMHVVWGTNLKVVIDDSVADFVGDDPEGYVVDRDVDCIFLKRIIGDVISRLALLLFIHGCDIAACRQENYGNMQVGWKHVEHCFRLFNNNVEFGKHLIFDCQSFLLVEVITELSGGGNFAVEVAQQLGIAMVLKCHIPAFPFSTSHIWLKKKDNE